MENLSECGTMFACQEIFFCTEGINPRPIVDVDVRVVVELLVGCFEWLQEFGGGVR